MSDPWSAKKPTGTTLIARWANSNSALACDLDLARPLALPVALLARGVRLRVAVHGRHDNRSVWIICQPRNKSPAFQRSSRS